LKVSLGLVVLWCAVMHGVLLFRVVLETGAKSGGAEKCPDSR
jgi:hypothetical protein